MTTTDQLVSQHINEYESRLKHIDELYERAQQASEQLDDDEIKSELGQYQLQRAELASHTEELKQRPMAHWREDIIQSAGPMGIWDILAQKLEGLVERIEK
jgi:hypothetical protein